MMKTFKQLTACAVSMFLWAVAAEVHAVSISYDLTTSVPTKPPTSNLTHYHSGLISFNNQAVGPGPTNLTLDIDFEGGGTPQRLELHTLGLDGAAFAPVTFGSLPSPLNTHTFGPSFRLFDFFADIPGSTSAEATVTLKNVIGSLKPDFANLVLTFCGTVSGPDCVFAALLPDMIDSPSAGVDAFLSFSGFTIDFGLIPVSEETYQLNSFEFDLIAGGITILQEPLVGVPEPPTVLLFALGLVVVVLRRAGRN